MLGLSKSQDETEVYSNYPSFIPRKKVLRSAIHAETYRHVRSGDWLPGTEIKLKPSTGI